MAKKIQGYLKLQVPAGQANPSPPIGPALGQRGINIMEFCKAFNAASQQMEQGAPIPVNITVFQDKSFTFEMKTPPASYFLMKAAGLSKGSTAPGREVAGRDDPAKLICDFLCQPELPVPISLHEFAFDALSTALRLSAVARQRAEILLDAYRIKWICIMLNDFLPVGGARRDYATSETREIRCVGQLAKVRDALSHLPLP